MQSASSASARSPIRFLAVVRARDGAYPAEIAWADEDGRVERHAIRPSPGWVPSAAAAEDEPHDVVARRAVDALAGRLVVTDGLAATAGLFTLLLRSASIADDLPLGDAAELWQHACTPLLRLLPPAGAVGRDAVLERLTDRAAAIVADAQADHPRPLPREAAAMATRTWQVWRTIQRRVAAELAEVTQ